MTKTVRYSLRQRLVAGFAYLSGFVGSVPLMLMEPYRSDSFLLSRAYRASAFSIFWLAANAFCYELNRIVVGATSPILFIVLNGLFAIGWIWLILSALRGRRQPMQLYRKLRVNLSKAINFVPETTARILTRDIGAQRQLRALQSTVDYVEGRLPKAAVFTDRMSLLEFACSQAPPTGLILEFGVFKGGSLNFIAERVDRIVHGFDSFGGLPEDWRTNFPKGTFVVDPRRVQRILVKNTELHIGLFDEVLPDFLEQHPGPAALIHVDCDLYSSTRYVLFALRERIAPGCIIVFDDYFNYPGWQQDGHKALHELAAEDSLRFEYIGYNGRGEQTAIRILGTGTPSRDKTDAWRASRSISG
jgi:hypothetical protein